jgi:hypothetical protein
MLEPKHGPPLTHERLAAFKVDGEQVPTHSHEGAADDSGRERRLPVVLWTEAVGSRFGVHNSSVVGTLAELVLGSLFERVQASACNIRSPGRQVRVWGSNRPSGRRPELFGQDSRSSEGGLGQRNFWAFVASPQEVLVLVPLAERAQPLDEAQSLNAQLVVVPPLASDRDRTLHTSLALALLASGVASAYLAGSTTVFREADKLELEDVAAQVGRLPLFSEVAFPYS